MRIATGILSIIMSIVVFLQTAIVGGLSDAVGDEDSSSAAAVGLLGGFLWLVSGALVFAFPAISMILYIVASVLFFAGTADFPDLGIYGVVSLAFAVMSFLGWRGKKKADKKKNEQEALMRLFLEQQTANPAKPLATDDALQAS